MRHPPLAPLALGGDDVHLWTVALDRPGAEVRCLFDPLTADERARAEGYRFDRDRGRFIVARGVLRAILGRYLNAAADRLRFCCSPHGKPGLAAERVTEESARGTLRFNVSHSGGVALYAITRGREIGVDVERIRSDVEIGSIAERFFSRREVAALRALPAHTQREAFFACWTRKEAYIKARGTGLSMPLDQFDVSLTPGEPAALLRTYADPLEAARWSLHALAPAPGYAAALAVQGHGWRLTAR